MVLQMIIINTMSKLVFRIVSIRNFSSNKLLGSTLYQNIENEIKKNPNFKINNQNYIIQFGTLELNEQITFMQQLLK